MSRRLSRGLVAPLIALAMLLAGCGGGGNSGGTVSDGGKEIRFARGVDGDAKTITIGGLQDLSGPGRVIGVPADGTIRAAFELLNNSGKLGSWKIKYVSKDHAYNPSESVRMYDEIREDVLAIVPSFGAPATMPLLDRLASDNMLTFTYTGSSAVDTEHTVWGATPYKYEAMRAVAHAVETGGEGVKVAIMHQDDDAGEDGVAGFRAAAAQFKAEIVKEVPFDASAEDFTAPVRLVRESGATHILVTSGPGQTVKLLSAAAAMNYDAIWYGNWATYIEAAFGQLPDSVWKDKFYWVNGLPFWGEDRPQMKELMDAYQKSDVAKDFPAPQNWSVLAYVQVQMLGEVIRIAIEDGDITPEGIMAAAQKVTDYDVDGLLLSPVDLMDSSALRSSRVLKPGVKNGEWEVAGDLQEMQD
ncbi:ABC transporter substrate-binding protein [Nocardioides daejeonensis]|uniref:ABC transporter substrate-binding protein n=1 Tax=Nocardioides daejeonensis TaxID=1046556 RepID=UPI000D7464BB|nr:ABC transporter substrate-binding protein [Nocardioides daejeonensis]